MVLKYLLWSNKSYPAVHLMDFISAVFNLLAFLYSSAETSHPYKQLNTYYIFCIICITYFE